MNKRQRKKYLKKCHKACRDYLSSIPLYNITNSDFIEAIKKYRQAIIEVYRVPSCWVGK